MANTNNCLDIITQVGGDSYDSAAALSLLPLAQLAMTTKDLNNLFLPPGWNKLANICCSGHTYTYPNVKGFLASGRVGTETETSAVLALGVDWNDWLKYYRLGPMIVSSVGSWSGVPGGSMTAYVYRTMYQALRASLWDSLKFLGTMKLRTVAISLGGPLAQFAALDLREGNTGPDGQTAPGNVGCLTFTTPQVANKTFADSFKETVTDSTALVAGTVDNKVDFFPLLTTGDLPDNLSNVQNIDTPVPEFDVPWVERSADFYTSALGGTPVPPPTIKPTVAQPDGFSRQLAFQFANLCAVSYQRFQHPNGQTMNISPYTVGQSINANGVNFATIFTSVDAVAVAFRGSCTWQEFADYSSNSQTENTDVANESLSVHTGAATLYNSPTEDGSSTTFKQQLLSEIQAVLENKKLYIAGHSFGGAVANLAALDLALGGEVTVDGVYTFGAIPIGDGQFKSISDSTLAGKSFQVARNDDLFVKLSSEWPEYAALDSQVAVTGTPTEDSYPYHSIRSYSRLIDPKE